MEINKIEVGRRIQSIRQELGLTLNDFGIKIDNADRSIVSRWERGISLPSNERLKTIADLGETTVHYLLHGKDSYENNIPKEAALSMLQAIYTELLIESKEAEEGYFIQFEEKSTQTTGTGIVNDSIEMIFEDIEVSVTIRYIHTDLTFIIYPSIAYTINRNDEITRMEIGLSNSSKEIITSNKNVSGIFENFLIDRISHTEIEGHHFSINDISIAYT